MVQPEGMGPRRGGAGPDPTYDLRSVSTKVFRSMIT